MDRLFRSAIVRHLARISVRASKQSTRCCIHRRSLSTVDPQLMPASVGNALTNPPNAVSFLDLKVLPHWMERLHRLGYTSPTLTQQRALPILMARQHAVLHAETGTGKTLCYLLPLLDATLLQLSSHDPGQQFLPLGLIIVPNAELAAQVHRVAASLVPEHANLIKPCYGHVGVTRRQNAGVLVTTPTGLKENIANALLSGLQYVVLDECDALLTDSSESGEGVRALLARFKRMYPEERPMHIFCAATVPNRGKTSVAAFLDKWYPEPEVVRITTPGTHRPLGTVAQAFWQIDASLPLTALEREAAARLKAKIEDARANALQPSEAARRDEDGTSPASAASAAEGTAAAGLPAEGEEQDQEEEEAEDDLGEEEEEEEDPLGRTMAGREAEDRYLSMREEEKRYLAKVAALRRHAVLHALLAPARAAGLDVDAIGAADRQASSTAAVLPSPSQSSRKKEGFRPSSQLGMLDASPPPRQRHVRAEGKRKVEALSCALDVPALTQALTAANAFATAPMKPFQPPSSPHPTLTAGQCALLPPTLIFVNTVAAAEALRSAVAAACPHVRVSELHSRVPDAARAARVSDFASGSIRVLVATDLAARGLDTTRVLHVIQAEFAGDAVAYIHRVGRTARAGGPGVGMCTSLVTRPEALRARAIIDALHAGHNFDAIFSRNRSLRKRSKRASVVHAEEEVIMEALEKEVKAAQGGSVVAA